MRLLTLVVLTACGLIDASAANSQAKPKGQRVADRFALLIGVDDYASANKLEYCGADQRALRDELLRSGFPKDNIYLLHDHAEENRYRPSKGNIERQLDIVLKLAERDDLLVLAFSGHGVHLDGKNFWCPSDATVDDPDTLVSQDKIYERLQKCRAAFKLVLVDACRNDPRPGGQRSFKATAGTRQFAEALESARPPEGLLLLNSCAPGEVSWEEKEFGHGVFMNFVLEGIHGGADADGDGFVSPDELRKYAGKKTSGYVARKFNDSQRPFLKGDATSDALEFALLRVAPTGGTPGTALGKPEMALTKPPVPADGQKTITNSIGMKFTLIPAGEFEMGNLEPVDGLLEFEHANGWEWARAENFEKEYSHHVRISKAFYLGTYEVTKGQFRKFADGAKYRTEAEKDGKGGGGYTGAEKTPFRRDPKFTWRDCGVDQSDQSPVVNVTWNDAVAFCDWLSKQEGKTYRLPTEAEWEYACRAGTTGRYQHGNDPEGLTRVGNVGDATVKKLFSWWRTTSSSDGYAFTCPVGQFKPNAFGLYDMHGNVWEWCADWYGEFYYRSSPKDDPQGPASGSDRILRGGSWRERCRSAERLMCGPSIAVDHVGFRVAWSPSGSK